ncbi:protein mono-ADP-ribosyltransferase TIPARP [Protopterus annectens]|uniref:protein mono-ADP-ribosyltransferase TIPARP n=1 Tax=Protopterus annectens TaxID=7888 RepID=UPI001CFB1C8B|nr:protein mono-ADP-ribosyltransferase TIPARP [Protopterus annectens]XP_043926429.1 protein mono-ADP-ribosyltransferase TIPARP [Protopterus annectens]XP_043926430.1 protein mono-ADP-ribosyltransferase TIPARP [Protopterus annectens]
MDKSLHLSEAETGPSHNVNTACSSGIRYSEMQGVFTPPLSVSDKVPPVKACFKKKQKLLAANTLRALEPIINSLLRSNALVAARDGVFVPTTPVNSPSKLCKSGVQSQSGLTELCSTAGKDGSSFVPSDTTVNSPGHMIHTQDVSMIPEHGSLHEVQSYQSQTDVPLAPSDSIPFQDNLIQSNVISTCPSEASSLLPDPSCMTQSALGHQKVKSGIFHDKTEEASLDLVFDLLTQLQYHTHAGDGIEICVEFLQGVCVYGYDCMRHHTVLPYHWQIRCSASQTWKSVPDESQEQLERLYCNPENDKIQVKYQGREFILDFNSMKVFDTVEFDQVRRLSTQASTAANSSCHTVWKYYCRDHFGWREYSEPVVRLIEEATCRGVKEVRFVTWQNQYVLNIHDGFQQNAGFRREIKRRPLFRSSLMLTPHLQTLGGISTAAFHPSGPAFMPVLSPVVSTSPSIYPETWLPMDSFQDFLQVSVAKEDKSYRTVYSLFHKTIPETKFRILNILRVQNQFLWEKYKRKKEYMCRKMTEMDRVLNERHLFHGTSADVVAGICKHNFDPRVCGKHATMFGQGSYFAKKASYSHNFSKKSIEGTHYMFLAKVLTGKYTVGNPSIRRPPPLNPLYTTSDLFDSCVDNCFEPQIFVIFNDDQSYPYFIIQYEEVSNTVSI